jgi:hypothetical protein
MPSSSFQLGNRPGISTRQIRVGPLEVGAGTFKDTVEIDLSGHFFTVF